jgi:hypothetical protein
LLVGHLYVVYTAPENQRQKAVATHE